MKNLAELKIAATKALEAKNVAKTTDSISELAKAQKTLNTSIEAFNEVSIADAYTKVRDSEKPILSIVETLTADSIGVKTETINKVKVDKIEDKKAQMSISGFVAWNNNIMVDIADHNWLNLLRRFNLLMTYKAVSELTDKDEIVKNSNLKEKLLSIPYVKGIVKDKPEMSNTFLLKELQGVIDAIVGKKVLKAISRHVNYIDKLICSRKSAGRISMPKDSTMEMLILDVMNNIFHKKGFAFDIPTYSTSENSSVADDETADVNSTDTSKTDDTTTDKAKK